MADEIKKAAEDVKKEAENTSKIMENMGKLFGDALTTGSKSFFSGLLKLNFKDFVKKTVDDLQKDSDFKADSKLLADALAGEVKEIASKLWGGITDAAKGLWEKIKEAFSSEAKDTSKEIDRFQNLKLNPEAEKPSLGIGDFLKGYDIKIKEPSKKTTQEAKTETPEETTKTLDRFQNVTSDSGAKKPSLGSGNYLAEYEGIINKTDKGTSKETIKRVEDNSAWGSLAKGFKDVSKTWNDVSQEMQKVGEGVATGMEKAFSSLFFDLIQGKFQGFKAYVKKFLDSIKEQVFKLIAEVLARQATAAIINFGLSLFGGGGGGIASGRGGGGAAAAASRHSGGYIPRFHAAGLASDERFAINKVGERYITKEQNEWLTGVARSMNNNQNMNVVVNVENKSSQPVKAKRGDTKFNGKEFVTNIILEDFTSNGPIVQAMKGV